MHIPTVLASDSHDTTAERRDGSGDWICQGNEAVPWRSKRGQTPTPAPQVTGLSCQKLQAHQATLQSCRLLWLQICSSRWPIGKEAMKVNL